MPKAYYVNEGNRIGGQEPQALGTTQTKVTASVQVTKGMVIEVTGDFTVGPASDGSLTVCGIAANDAEVGEEVVIEAEGYVKLDASSAVITAGDKIVAAGAGKIKSMPSLDVTATPNESTIEAALNALAGVCGIAIAGCDADGVAYVKLSI